MQRARLATTVDLVAAQVRVIDLLWVIGAVAAVALLALIWLWRKL